MSKANSPIKVLKTAIKRLNKGWTTGEWSAYDPETDTVSVCLEGAIFGFCTDASTPQQQEALQACEQIIFERWKDGEFDLRVGPDAAEKYKETGGKGIVPAFNDRAAKTADELVEICKLAIIRLETGGPIGDDEFDDEEINELLEGIKS